MRLLVTRPEPDAATLKAQLIGMGHEVLVEPLLNVVFHAIDNHEIDLEEAQALIATSRNGVRALGRSPFLQAAIELPIYVVGPGTAGTARALGFKHVVQGPRDARALVGFIADHAQVNAGSLVYLAGAQKAVDLGGELRHLGFHVQEPVVYAVKAAKQLSPPIVARFAADEIDGVILLSPQTAKIYVQLVLAHKVGSKALNAKHYCLSAAVARALAELGAASTFVPSQPDLKSLLSLVAGSVSNLQ